MLIENWEGVRADNKKRAEDEPSMPLRTFAYSSEATGVLGSEPLGNQESACGPEAGIRLDDRLYELNRGIGHQTGHQAFEWPTTAGMTKDPRFPWK